eukprot:CAMPEP_0185586614 /NCGR_PEP_ID=MMETSP0434-20130131/45156_1 /TAXON_ID=626734 ORGANISM="Favella taraikaensis, Strain Fe Narragansett Bay" /NCGR_SAMPLE_ID=MMETSP0434 /ASSEMBLY_ACC=CAM_ASM_000379 /LENGTH=98 /DNA_ID=CAMNT_0028207855 /DNA_START=201 /DNA_END=494 /DNA_ORIENTATION=+
MEDQLIHDQLRKVIPVDVSQLIDIESDDGAFHPSCGVKCLNINAFRVDGLFSHDNDSVRGVHDLIDQPRLPFFLIVEASFSLEISRGPGIDGDMILAQ